MKKTIFALSLLLATSLFAEAPLEVNLKDPEFVSGVLRTESGGVITAPGLRIQARNIAYTDKTVEGQRVQKVVAEGDLLVEYEGRFYVGEKLEYDLINRRGTLIDGITFTDIWFIGGEKIELLDDGSFLVYGGYITTSESPENAWEIKASSVRISPNGLFSAKNLRLKVAQIPLFWFPAIKSNLKFLRDTPIRIRLLWDKGIGPRVSLRARVYSWRDFNAYLRFDYRYSIGPGAAFETEYYSPDGLTEFITRSYGAYDKSFPDEQSKKRWRFQGLFHKASMDGRTSFHAQWDRFSDERIVGDFKDMDFEINTQKCTFAKFDHLQENAFSSLTVRPNINPFLTLNQELPYTAVGIRPFSIWKTGIISENYAGASYLDYVYSRQVSEFLPSRHSARLETNNSLYRPFHLGSVNMTPRVGLTGIFYSNSPERHNVGQLVYSYGGDLSTRLVRCSETSRHLVEPYVTYLGYTRPQAGLNQHFIFDITDGYFRQDQFRFGVRNRFYRRDEEPFLPFFEMDLYSYAFFGARSFTQTLPKGFFQLGFNRPTWSLQGASAWNFQQKLLDYGNVRFLWTINASFALGVEFRHRSSFDWRKADHESYTLDFARTINELLDSPLSDRRNTLLTKAHIRFTPRWNMQIETHHGWGRKHEPSYNGARVEFYSMITSSWQVRFAYEYTPYDPFRISYSFKLIR